MKTLTLMVLLGLSVEAMAAPVKAAAMRLCIDSGGGIVTRKKCKGGESVVDGAAIAAMSGGGWSPGGCNVAIETDQCEAATGAAGVRLACDDGKFLMTHGWVSSPSAVIVPRRVEIETSGGLAQAVRVVTQCEVGAVGGGCDDYVLIVTGICCPR